MSKVPLSKSIQVVLLVAAAAVGGLSPLTDWRMAALFVLALGNAVVTPRGTSAVRAVTVVWAIIALAAPHDVPPQPTLVAAWLLWPPAFFMAWALGRRTASASWASSDTGSPAARRARVVSAALIATVAGASLAFRAIVSTQLQQTAVLFVGVPALLAIGVVFFVHPRSAVGVACKAVTIGLAVSLLFLGEGVLCIVMSAPLFYGVAVLVGSCVHVMRRPPRSPLNTTLSSLVLLALVPSVLEGVTGGWSMPRSETVTDTRVIEAPAAVVAAAVMQMPRFDRPLPGLLRHGFPRPEAVRLEERRDAPRWVIRFRGGETRLNGTEPRAGDLILELQEAGPGFVRWRALADDSHMTHFLTWRGASVRWEALDAHSTRVTWTLEYRRDLDPAWYFGPLERHAVRLAAGYLIDTVATP